MELNNYKLAREWVRKVTLKFWAPEKKLRAKKSLTTNT